jgi:hypothetical protein
MEQVELKATNSHRIGSHLRRTQISTTRNQLSLVPLAGGVLQTVLARYQTV